MTEITTIQTLLETFVTQLSVGYPVRSAEVTFDGETLVTDCTLLKSDTPFDFETVLDGRTVLDVETLGWSVAAGISLACDVIPEIDYKAET